MSDVNGSELSQGYVIVLDDDPMIAPIIGKILQTKVQHFRSLEGLNKRAERYTPLGAFVDIQLEDGTNGLDIIPDLRKAWPETAIIVITASQDSELISQALVAGANDFIRKPLDKIELRSRFYARYHEMRRRFQDELEILEDITVLPSRGRVEGPGGTRFLSQNDIKVLLELMRLKNEVLTKDSIRRLGWGGIQINESSIHKMMHRLRNAIEDVSEAISISSKYGKGYQINPKKKYKRSS